MNKIFNKLLPGVLFLLGVILVPAFKVDAAITVHVYADGVANSKTVSYNQQVRITWDSLGATSCTNNFGGSATTSGWYDYTATTTQTFTVNCSRPDLAKVWIDNSNFEWIESGVYNDSKVKVGIFYGGFPNNSSCTSALNGQTLYNVYCFGADYDLYSCEWYKAKCSNSEWVFASDIGSCVANNKWCGDVSSATDLITATQAYKFTPGICPANWGCSNYTN